MVRTAYPTRFYHSNLGSYAQRTLADYSAECFHFPMRRNTAEYRLFRPCPAIELSCIKREISLCRNAKLQLGTVHPDAKLELGVPIKCLT